MGKAKKAFHLENNHLVYISALILIYEILSMCSMEMPILVDVF